MLSSSCQLQFSDGCNGSTTADAGASLASKTFSSNIGLAASLMGPNRETSLLLFFGGLLNLETGRMVPMHVPSLEENCAMALQMNLTSCKNCAWPGLPGAVSDLQVGHSAIDVEVLAACCRSQGTCLVARTRISWKIL